VSAPAAGGEARGARPGPGPGTGGAGPGGARPGRAARAGDAWAPGPPVPRLSGDAVDVWRADLDAAGGDAASLLSDDERERAARFVAEQDGARWAAAHGTLRALLGRYLDIDPHALRFVAGEHGKPALAGARGVAELRFNLSHSAGVALCAFARGRGVGVDVELPRRPLDAVALARRTFGDDEARRLGALDPAARERELLRLWTRHEALAKCHGTGIARALPIGVGRPAPWVAELPAPAPGAAAALALDGPPCDVRCFDWRG
jgi:4'-phosphopantetheinyl transferase